MPISEDLYERGQRCPGTGAIFWHTDPEDPDRAICPRCRFSVAIVRGAIDTHLVLPERIDEKPSL